MAFLCHIILGDCFSVDPMKMVVVKNWPRSLSPSIIRRSIGLTRYYKRFVEVSPLRRLTQKKVKFQWFDECEKSI